MKKPSKKWKEFVQIIEIIRIKIRKQQKRIAKANQEIEDLNEQINLKWEKTKQNQEYLKNIRIKKEHDSINRLFLRKEEIKSKIETLYFDISVLEKDLINKEKELIELEKTKKKLEKREYALDEIKESLR